MSLAIACGGDVELTFLEHLLQASSLLPHDAIKECVPHISRKSGRCRSVIVPVLQMNKQEHREVR